MAALRLSQRTAGWAGLAPEAVWDAVFFALGAVLVFSRLLLIAEDPRAFLRYPLLVLSLPSLSAAGMALTGAAWVVYLRWKRLPLLAVCDACSAPAALLAVALALGRWEERTGFGMPTALPWAVRGAQPVALYSAAVSLGMLAMLMWTLARRHAVGQVTALALTGGGLAAFLLGMLALPEEPRGDSLLDPGQYVALAALAAGLVMFFRSRRRSPNPAQEPA